MDIEALTRLVLVNEINEIDLDNSSVDHDHHDHDHDHDHRHRGGEGSSLGSPGPSCVQRPFFKVR